MKRNKNKKKKDESKKKLVPDDEKDKKKKLAPDDEKDKKKKLAQTFSLKPFSCLGDGPDMLTRALFVGSANRLLFFTPHKRKKIHRHVQWRGN